MGFKPSIAFFTQEKCTLYRHLLPMFPLQEGLTQINHGLQRKISEKLANLKKNQEEKKQEDQKIVVPEMEKRFYNSPNALLPSFYEYIWLLYLSAQF